MQINIWFFLSVLAVSIALGAIFTADKTMTQDEANRLAKPAIVYMCEGVQEDNLYINDSDIGRVDFQKGTDCEY